MAAILLALRHRGLPHDEIYFRARLARAAACATALLLSGLSAAPAATPDYGFKADVTLSQKAAALLARRKEKIIVIAYYEGVADAAHKKQPRDGRGLADLGEDSVTIPGDGGIASFTGKGLNLAHIGWVKAPMVLVNVVSARLSTDDNLLNCDIFEDTIAKAQAKTIPIGCKVIGEGDIVNGKVEN